MEIPKFIQNIDWELLRKQKAKILVIRNGFTEIDKSEEDAIDGIINLIDALQDYAVDELGIAENKVFDLEPEQEPTIKITKKAFKEQCSFHEYGRGRRKRNAIYFDYMRGNGYKYMVKAEVENCKKAELFEVLYKWVTGIEEPYSDYRVQYRYAAKDSERFKVAISG